MFYEEVESGVREWVRILRDGGVNTECSCHHEGYIQCQTLDTINDIERIRRILEFKGLYHYEINYSFTSIGNNLDNQNWYRSIVIKSKEFRI